MALDQADIEILNKMMKTNGAYEVTKALAAVAKEHLEGHHEDAVIHHDSRILDKAVEEMTSVHPLRFFASRAKQSKDASAQD